MYVYALNLGQLPTIYLRLFLLLYNLDRVGYTLLLHHTVHAARIEANHMAVTHSNIFLQMTFPDPPFLYLQSMRSYFFFMGLTFFSLCLWFIVFVP